MSIMIILKCRCGEQFNLERTKEIPEDAIYIESNWCPICQDNADEPYEETYITELPEVKDPNQSELFND